MAAMTTQVTSLSPSAQGGRTEPGREPRSADSAEMVDSRQAPGVEPAENTEAQPLSVEELTDAVSRINDHMQVVRRNLEFNLDEESGKTIVKVIDAETEEVVRQIPSEEIVELAKHLKEIRGLLFKAEA